MRTSRITRRIAVALTVAAGPRGELLELFIDCHWPRRFLAREED